MQELGIDVVALLHEHVDFLENVGDVELPEGLAVAREALLGRTRALLERSTSPEPYLDMNAGRAAHADGKLNGAVEEYIAPEERTPQRGSLHYYESFQEFPGNGVKGNAEVDKELENLKLIYTSFSASQAKGRAIKSGTLLLLRRERKMFSPLNVFWINKSCWVCLVGSHVLVYANERDSHPYQVVPLRGYSCRAAPGALPRDPRRSDSAFEIFCPGERTVQFVASSPEEMREWVEAVQASVEPANVTKSKGRAPTFVEILDLETSKRPCLEKVKEEQDKYQDVLSSPKSKPKEKQPAPPQVLPAKPIPTEAVEPRSENPREAAPPLPARTRRLPSLPSSQEDDAAAEFVVRDEPYDEEGLYHCVEDVRAQAEYQNCRAVVAMVVPETYDDVEGAGTTRDAPDETYDDVQSVVRSAREEPISYDDVQSVSSNLRAQSDKSDKASEKSEKSDKQSKTQQKRSFLGRMYKRKESMRMTKEERKPKSPSTTVPPATSPVTSPATEQPCYDDVSSLASPSSSPVSVPPEENYLTPPPPRPIYSQPPPVTKCVAAAAMPPEDMYDDIASCLEIANNGCRDCLNVDVIQNYPNNGSVLSDLQLSIEQEHYQVPKSSLRRVVEQQQQLQQQEETYDDVQLSQTFKNKQRDSSVTAGSERSVWSRISGARRQTLNSADSDDSKVRPLHKLFSKVETTLGKATKVNGVAN